MYTASPATFQKDADLPGLVVELVGPSASGKTTLAKAVVQEFPEVRLVASARPAEMETAARSRLLPVAARGAKIVQAIPHLGNRTRSCDTTERLIALIPPASPLKRLRYRRYLSELSQRLRRERAAGGVALLDQGFVTAVGSLAAISGTSELNILARALSIVPQPDLVVWIETPREVIAGRLHDRRAAQSAAERLFELGIPETLRQIGIFETLAPLVEASGIPVIRVACPDREALGPAAGAMRGRIAELMREKEA
ncbi:AAA family ATPase [Defluviimonas sp. WL0024]|uniref:AAA family ATPase n=1 Tax=Albidovulum salinarum TaxID=2984153 RepID=A0ABT2X4U6_9RHOB|nr:AAA family ATPase [Defluviimonas sp. WL0024]MCU9848379.1 AAA family ATPase [Defluviimonas sp. WL0024]